MYWHLQEEGYCDDQYNANVAQTRTEDLVLMYSYAMNEE